MIKNEDCQEKLAKVSLSLENLFLFVCLSIPLLFFLSACLVEASVEPEWARVTGRPMTQR